MSAPDDFMHYFNRAGELSEEVERLKAEIGRQHDEIKWLRKIADPCYEQFLTEEGRPTMTLHDSTFDYIKPTDAQMHDMTAARKAATEYATALDTLIPEGPDKTYLLRKLREVAMWANVAITRNQDGSPRGGQNAMEPA